MAQAHLPPFVPAVFSPLDPTTLQYVSVADAQSLALNYDRAQYNMADASFQRNQRDLYNTFRRAESETLNALEGNLAPAIQSSFVQMALATAGPLADNAPPGSLGNYAIARTVANDAYSYRQSAQSELDFLNQIFPERSFGLGGQGAIDVVEQQDATFNETVATNNLGINNTARANAVGKAARDEAEYLREFSRPRNLPIYLRTLDGMYTGYQQGGTYGIYAGVILAILGAADGTFNSPLYRYRFEHQRDTAFSSSQYGANANLQNFGAYQEALSGQLGPNAPAQVAPLPQTSGLYGPTGTSGAPGPSGPSAPTGPSGPGG